MSEERVQRFITESQKDLIRQSAGNKFLQEAETLLEKGDAEGAGLLFVQAAEAFEVSASEYRSGKSFKKAATLMCTAGDLYSDMGDSDKAIKSYTDAAEDLLSAAKEHLLWDDDKETKRGTALAVAASMIYLMVGKDTKAFQKSRTFNSEHASKLRFPDVVGLSQIPQQIESALQSMNLASFSAAETAVVTQLKAALIGGDAESFTKYVEKGLDMAREMLRGKLKVPKVSTQLELPVDMTFTEQFPLKVTIQNHGDGDALNLRAEWHLDEGLQIVSGEIQKELATLNAGDAITIEITIKSTKELMGIKEYSILVRGSYLDQLKTAYSLQAGPGTLILKDFKEGEKLLHDLDVTDGRIGILQSTVAQSSLEKEPLDRIVAGLSGALQKARAEIAEGQIDAARTRIGIVNEMVDNLDEVLGDDSLAERLDQARTKTADARAASVVDEVTQSIASSFDTGKTQLDEKKESAKTEWTSESEKKKSLAERAQHLQKQIAEIVREFENLYEKLPSASTTDDPEEAAKRTRVRTSMEAARTKLEELQATAAHVAQDRFLSETATPDVPPKVQLALETLVSLKDEVESILQAKKAELE